jgi:hypothetical protein
MLRLNFLMAALLAVALTACPSRDTDPKPDAGDECVGECPDAGGDGGDENPDGGDSNPDPNSCESPWDYDAERSLSDDECTPFTSKYQRPSNDDCKSISGDSPMMKVEGVEEARYGLCRHQYLELENVVVVGIDEAYTDSNGVRRNFWVADAADPQIGIWVHFRGTDTWINETGDEIDTEAESFERIVLGDVINIKAKLDQQPGYNTRDGRRWMLTNHFKNGQGVILPVEVALQSRGTGEAPSPVTVPVCFGDANDGYNRPGQRHVGMRVHIPGPLELINASPVAFSNPSKEGWYENGQSAETVFGFELSGGILVNDYKLYDLEGEERCDWRKKAIEAAAEGKKVVFPNGITGVWENYTHAPCNVVDCKTNYWGGVPGTYDFCTEEPDDGNYYTNVLFPQSCDDVVAVIE